MMGRTHALTGALAGLLVGRLIGLDAAAVGQEPGPTATLAACAALGPFAAVTAGYALIPDLDHRSSAATRLLGPMTGLLSRGLRAGSGWLYKHTKGPADEPGGEHRHLTHTLVFAAAIGGVCAVTTARWGPWAVLGWLVFGLLLAVDRLGPLVLVAYGAGAAAWLPTTLHSNGLPDGQALLTALDASSGWLGLAVGLGCLVHCLGDMLTESGCPLLWPFLPLKGETWYEIRPPRWLRFRTGTPFEQLVCSRWSPSAAWQRSPAWWRTWSSCSPHPCTRPGEGARMTHQLDRLAFPQVEQMTVEERLWRADECRTLATALREQAGVLHDGAPTQAPLAIQQLDRFAQRLLHRAARLDVPDRSSRP